MAPFPVSFRLEESFESHFELGFLQQAAFLPHNLLAVQDAHV